MHLSTTFFLVLALITFPVNLVSSRSAELIQHWNSAAPRTHHQPRSTQAERDDLHLEDVVLTASVDGKFHAFDRKNGRLKWSMRGTPSGAANQTLLYDLVHSEQAYPHDIHDDGFEFFETYVIEPQSGEIFVLPPGASVHAPLERLPYTIMQLVDLSPFQFPGDDQRMFLGRKETSIVTLDLNSGNVLSVHTPDQCVWEMTKAEPSERQDEHSSDTSGEGNTERPWTKSPPPILPIRIGRTDYHVSIRIEGKGVIQQLSFSRYGPNNVDRELQSQWIKTPDDRYVQSLPSGDVISFRLSDPMDPDAVGSNRGTVDADAAGRKSEVTLVAWHGELPKPVVAVFDVLTNPSRNTPFVLIQPQPKLTDIFKDPGYQSQIAQLPDSTFVGLIGHSLYAMSHLAYPMVVFSDALSYNPSVSKDGTTDLGAPASGGPEHQNHCRTPECYVGTHPSGFAASSRVSRLIEGGKTPQWIDGPAHYTMPMSTPSSSIFLATPSAVASIPASLDLTWTGTLAFALACITGYIVFFGALGSGTPERIASIPSAVAPNVLLSTGVSNGVVTRGDSTDSSSADPTSFEPPMLSADFNARKDSSTEPGGDLDVEVRRTRRRPRGRHKGRGKKEDNGKDEPEEPDISVPLPSKGGTAPPEPQTVRTVSGPSDELFAGSTVISTLTVSDSILGYGSHGTVVYQGLFQGRAVAVKRLLRDFVTVASREVMLLQESDDHPNVIRYYYQESRDNFVYIALELCPASLEDLIQRPNVFEEINAVFDPKRALSQITAGLRHLHSLKIVHRDIKPQNILFSQAKKGQHRMLISDFGLCKKLESDETSFMPTRHGHLGAGTVGWRAPEILRGEVNLDVSVIESLGGSDGKDGDSTIGSTNGPGLNSASGSSSGARTRLTKSVDIFALGCLFFYTLTNGEHPFGGPFEREPNILKDEKDLRWLERLGEEGVEAQDLICNMLDPQPRQRLDTTECLVHPFFWTPARRLGFLQDASDRFEIMQRDPPELGLQQLESGAHEVVGGDWVRKFDKIFIDNLGKFRKYNGRSIQDVLRALRNKKHHYQDLPDNVKRHLGPLPDGFLAYFTRRFPTLFLHVYYVVANGPLRGESMFQSYFKFQEY